jgi:hypothetical protein
MSGKPYKEIVRIPNRPARMLPRLASVVPIDGGASPTERMVFVSGGSQVDFVNDGLVFDKVVHRGNAV